MHRNTPPPLRCTLRLAGRLQPGTAAGSAHERRGAHGQALHYDRLDAFARAGAYAARDRIILPHHPCKTVPGDADETADARDPGRACGKPRVGRRRARERQPWHCHRGDASRCPRPGRGRQVRHRGPPCRTRRLLPHSGRPGAVDPLGTRVHRQPAGRGRARTATDVPLPQPVGRQPAAGWRHRWLGRGDGTGARALPRTRRPFAAPRRGTGRGGPAALRGLHRMAAPMDPARDGRAGHARARGRWPRRSRGARQDPRRPRRQGARRRGGLHHRYRRHPFPRQSPRSAGDGTGGAGRLRRRCQRSGAVGGDRTGHAGRPGAWGNPLRRRRLQR